MTLVETLTAFSAIFVKENFRDRFVHEALKKPRKLHARICHKIEDVFPPPHKSFHVSFDPDAPCILLDQASKFEETTWREASNKMNLGGGLLIIDGSANKFYAETEASPASEV